MRQELMEARRSKASNIIDAGVEVLREKIGNLRKAVMEGIIKVRRANNSSLRAIIVVVVDENSYLCVRFYLHHYP
jgi:hypothetical protein